MAELIRYDPDPHRRRSSPEKTGTAARRLVFRVLAVGVFLLACSLPWRSTTVPPDQPTAPAPAAAPTLPPTPTIAPILPPALVETDPPAGGRLALRGPLVFYFNQAMDRRSVEGAFSGVPALSGQFSWLDESTVAFTPDQQLPAGVEQKVSLGTAAQSANGLALRAPVNLAFRTAEELRRTSLVPAPGDRDILPQSPIIVAFNQPVVPLGGDPNAGPDAFSLKPAAAGEGGWINTSTYAFNPTPSLAGGVEYSVIMNPALTSAAGAPLSTQPVGGELEAWTFQTAAPALVSLHPDPSDGALPLDAGFTIEFNQPMDRGRTAGLFSLEGPGGGAVAGSLIWEEGSAAFTFQPDVLLTRGGSYRLTLSPGAPAAGGTTLEFGLDVQYETAGDLTLVESVPASGGSMSPHGTPALTFNIPLADVDWLEWISISPPVPELSAYWDPELQTLHLISRFEPEREYVLTLDPGLPDQWGGTLGAERQVRFQTEAFPASLSFPQAGGTLYLTPDYTRLGFTATNLSAVEMSLSPISVDEFLSFIGPGGFERLTSFASSSVRRWVEPLNLPRNEAASVEFDLASGAGPLNPGLYHLRVDSPSLRHNPPPVLLVVSETHLLMKMGQEDGLIWALDPSDGRPVPDIDISLLSVDGSVLAAGRTGPDGLFQAEVPVREDPFEPIVALSGEPGAGAFTLASSSWTQGVDAFLSGFPVDFTPPGLRTYLYTDRPIYRPGEQVHFRAILREASNGRYSLPELTGLGFILIDPFGHEIERQTQTLSSFGTAHGSFLLDDEAPPGHYRLETDYSSLAFQVAAFRKPEIDLDVDLSPPQHLAGEELSGEVAARFFFGAPAVDLTVEWTLYRQDQSFVVPGFRTGPLDLAWQRSPWNFGIGLLGEEVARGEGRTDEEGELTLQLQTQLEESLSRYTLEATIQDDTGFQLSNRADVLVHPAIVYLAARPDTWVGSAGRPMSYEVKAVDWEGSPVGDLRVQASFTRVTWVRDETSGPGPAGYPTFSPVYDLVDQTGFELGLSGRATVRFTPPEPGTYQLEMVSGSAKTQLLVWVGGQGDPIWPALPNQRLPLTADRDRYQPGDTAVVFVPNPMAVPASALVTLERGRVMESWVIDVPSSGVEFPILLRREHAPNAYVSVTLLGFDAAGQPDFRQGYQNLIVDAEDLFLEVDLVAEPDQAGPGDQVRLMLSARDASGDPVVGELSVAVVDQAALALAVPNASGIAEAYYGVQPLGVRTSLGMAVAAWRRLDQVDGIGGGGGGELATPSIREDFENTALWMADVVTDANGDAELVLNLPDNLTAWRVQTRGVTPDTQVGEATIEVLATKELLIQPATPRFFVAGDHVLLSAVVHNNSGRDLDVQVSLEMAGFRLDDPDQAVQALSLAPSSRKLVTWWGTVEGVEQVDLVFRAQAEDLQDAARPVWGALPVSAYLAPQTYATAGTLDGEGERLELISAPRSFVASKGRLDVELSPSLLSVAFEALPEEGVPLWNTEQAVSELLPVLVIVRRLQALGLETPAMEERLEHALADSLAFFEASQQTDGGWQWWRDGVGESEPFITAYVLTGLAHAKEAGASIPSGLVERAVEFLVQSRLADGSSVSGPALNRAALQEYALSQHGAADEAALAALFGQRERMNPWARAFLALSLEALSPGDERARTLLANLQNGAVRIGTGAFWPLEDPGRENMSTTLANSAVVLYALARRDPAQDLVSESARYLVSSRGGAGGGWSSSYETAWALLALAEVAAGTGELAGDFEFSASLNGSPLLEGVADGSPQPLGVRSAVVLEELAVEAPNALVVSRGPGLGRLYYRASLLVARPVEEVASASQGIAVSRVYNPPDQDCLRQHCPEILQAGQGEIITVRMTLALENDAHFLVLEDPFPAGAEALDPDLETSQQGERPFPLLSIGSAGAPKAAWSWPLAWFGPPQVLDDRVLFAADYLPAGTYELSYQLVLNTPGSFRVMPARSWQVYFPEVQGNSSGETFTIVPRS